MLSALQVIYLLSSFVQMTKSEKFLPVSEKKLNYLNRVTQNLSNGLTKS